LNVAEEQASFGFAQWQAAACEPLTGDASARKYFRLRTENQSAILMDASRVPDSIAPFIHIAKHLRQIGFSSPKIFARETDTGLLLLEDFGDASFAKLLENPDQTENLFTLATDVLIALHQHPQAIPENLREYHPEKMLEDIELFVQWRTPDITALEKEDFRAAWRKVLPLAHRVPASLLLRDYHVANLMLLPNRAGIQQAGLLDFQDAYRGPVTYDLISLLEDARRDVPAALQKKLFARYLAAFPALDREIFETSLAILAAQRHTRVLGIFERLARHEGKLDYRRLHSPRVERLLRQALKHPILADVKIWMERHAVTN
jgi:aminoglycoside/choline kinase family phosphotransferase